MTNSDTLELLNYLVDNVVMIKARMIRSDTFKDEGKIHNERLIQEALTALTDREETLIREAKIEEHNIVLDKWASVGESNFAAWSEKRISGLTKQPQGKK